jgi:hypothetical protein
MSTLLVEGTLLNIIPLSGGANGLTLTPYSARGLTQTYKQILAPDAVLERDVNGVMHDLSPPWAKQYTSTISCTDGQTPCLNDAWRGAIVEVWCCAELNYVTGGTPDRPVVSGSTRVDGPITFFRPILIMRVIDIDASFREWAAEWQWRIQLEENQHPTGFA